MFIIFIEDDAGTSQDKKSPGKVVATGTSFGSLCRLCVELFDEPSYNAKTVIVKRFLDKGNL